MGTWWSSPGRASRSSTSTALVVEREVQIVDWDEEAAEKAGYETFMLKEIHEQPTSLADTLAERVGPEGRVVLDGLGLAPDTIRNIKQVIIVACGTSYHAGLVGKYALERWARVPVEVEVASEFRYRDPVIGPDCLCIAISQSGETADTLAAMRLARQAGAHVLAVTNIVGSQATREADGVLFTRAGLEIGVAATKTFLTQVLAMLLLSLYFADHRGSSDRRPGAGIHRGAAAHPGLAARLSGGWRGGEGGRGGHASTPPAASSSAWAATWACRWRSREPSSSRRSPTSPPTPTRPER